MNERKYQWVIPHPILEKEGQKLKHKIDIRRVDESIEKTVKHNDVKSINTLHGRFLSIEVDSPNEKSYKIEGKWEIEDENGNKVLHRLTLVRPEGIR